MKTNHNEGLRTVFGSQWAWDDCWLMLSLMEKGQDPGQSLTLATNFSSEIQYL